MQDNHIVVLNNVDQKLNNRDTHFASVLEAVFAITVFERFEIAVSTSCSASDVGGLSG